MSSQLKETTAQRAERLKKEKNPWECLHEIRQFAQSGYESVPPEWRSNYLRWWGIYPQGDGAGVLGGKGGEGKSTQFFMLRIRVPNGLLFSHQLRTIAEIANQYARGVADITVRHNIQLHWIGIEALPDIFERLWRCGLTTMSACGDDTRNITGCPLAGIDADEICDASSLALRATHMLVGNSDFYNLPRKYKICVTGCRSWCCYPEINDVGLTAIKRVRDGAEEIGFSLRVGGGLSSEPFFARRLNAFVHWNQVPDVILGVTRIFRDAGVLRQHRERARLKYLFKHHGWTDESFQEELERLIGYHLDPAEHEDPPADVFRDHVGIRPQKQPGCFYVGTSVLRGRITPAQMLAAANLADSFANGELRTTPSQSLLIINVPERNAEIVGKELTAVGLPTAASAFRRGSVTCTGTEFCRLAITETKNFAHWLVDELEDRIPGFEQHLKLHITGCPNGCGQHWIADIGIEGKKLRVDGQFVDAYYFCLGGSVGAFQSIARTVGYRCLATEVPAAIERLMRTYLETRNPDENLRSFFARHSDSELRTCLAGAEAIPVSRDPSSHRIPDKVAG
jgi:sulfite reductase (ferredoxin)